MSYSKSPFSGNYSIDWCYIVSLFSPLHHIFPWQCRYCFIYSHLGELISHLWLLILVLRVQFCYFYVICLILSGAHRPFVPHLNLTGQMYKQKIYRMTNKCLHGKKTCKICETAAFSTNKLKRTEHETVEIFHTPPSFCHFSMFIPLWLAGGMWQDSPLNVLVCLTDICWRCHGESSDGDRPLPILIVFRMHGGSSAGMGVTLLL